nr:hypothetical protein [Cognatishimia sp. F0-27]
MSDALEDGRRFRVLSILDAFSRECLASASIRMIEAPQNFHGA